MRPRWTPEAAADLEIADYLREHRPELTRSTARRLYDSVNSLKISPLCGRPGRMGGTRELILAPLPYIVVYRVASGAIEVLHIDHSAGSPRESLS